METAPMHVVIRGLRLAPFRPGADAGTAATLIVAQADDLDRRAAVPFPVDGVLLQRANAAWRSGRALPVPADFFDAADDRARRDAVTSELLA
jgi:hypothetical protein